MSQKFKVIGLALLAVCAFGAFSASAAQAEPMFTVGGGAVSGEPAVATTVNLTGTSLLLEAPEIPLTIACTELSVKNGKISTFGGSAEKLTFSGCTVSSNSKCRVKEFGGTTFGTINTLPLTAALKTVGTKTDVLFSPKETNFVELEIAKASETVTCPISGKYKVTGNAAVQVTTGTSETYVKGEASKAIQQAYNATSGAVKLTVGAKEAWLIGKADLALASDGNWGVDA